MKFKSHGAGSISVLSSASSADKESIATPSSKAQGVVVGEPAPQPLGLGPTGEALTVSQYRGKVLVVSFWASWCAPCLKELPVLDAIQRKVGSERLAVVMLNIEDCDVYRNIRRRLGDAVSLTLAHDRSGSVFPLWGKGGIPYMVILDPQGRVHAKYRGYGDAMLDGILEDLNELLVAQAGSAQAAASR